MSEHLDSPTAERRDVSPRTSRPPSFDTEGLRVSLEAARVSAIELHKALTRAPDSLPEGLEEGIVDLTDFAEELIEDPEANEMIAQADAPTLKKAEAALAQKTKALLEDAEAAEDLAFTMSLDGIEDSYERVNKICEALGSPETRRRAVRAIQTEEMASLVWHNLESSIEECTGYRYPWNDTRHLAFLDLAEASAQLREPIRAFIRDNFGIGYQNKLLERGYIQQLSQIKEQLINTRYQGLKLIDVELTLQHLVAIHETFGSVDGLLDICGALDIGKYLPDFGRKQDMPILVVKHSTFSKDAFEARIDIQYEFKKDEYGASISRSFEYGEQYDEQSLETKKAIEVSHNEFLLPEAFQNQNIAKKVLCDSFEWYFQQREHGHPVSRVNLLANVGVGGYAWAAYGFGWNEEAMVEKYAKDQKKKGALAETLKPEEAWTRTLTSHVADCQKRADKFLKYVRNLPDGKREAIQKELEEITSDAANPALQELVTPQRLVSLGKKPDILEKLKELTTEPANPTLKAFTQRLLSLGENQAIRKELEEAASDNANPTLQELARHLISFEERACEFVRIEDETGAGGWYLEPTDTKGKIVNRMHLGKVMCLGTSWHGTLPLEPKTELEIKQLALLKARLEL